jgi:beta-N-acetylhexosaminidase
MSIGPVMLDIEGVSLSSEDKELLRHPQTGGIILFSRNFESTRQLTELCTAIHELREPHLIIAVDHEGGRVQRFREGFTHLPPMAVLGKLHDTKGAKPAEAAAEKLAWLMSAELLACGVDISFVPVLDISHGVSGVIGDRAFHRDPQVVARLAQAFVRGMRKAGMAATGKHFPGHGGVKEDSHIAKPVDPRKLADLMMSDIIPFERLIPNGLTGIMPAHVVYPEVDTKPAGYSAIWLQKILRQQLDFQGVIFSDDLSMDAADIGNSYSERAKLAIDAGCDMVLVCNHREAAIEVLGSLEQYKNPVSQIRLARMHGHNTQGSLADLIKRDTWRQVAGLSDQLRGDADGNLTLELNV